MTTEQRTSYGWWPSTWSKIHTQLIVSPYYLRSYIYGFNQPQVAQYCTIYYWKISTCKWTLTVQTYVVKVNCTWKQPWWRSGLPRQCSGTESACQCRRCRVRSLGREELPEKETATHSRTLPWEIPQIEEPGGVQSTGSHRVRHSSASEQAHRHMVLRVKSSSSRTMPS